MTATDEVERLTGEDDIEMATFKQVTGHGAYAALGEYTNMNGFLHTFEIVTRRVRNVECYVRPKQKAVLKVIKVNKARGEVDTSLKHISSEQRKSKLIKVKNNEKATISMEFIKSKLKLTDVQVAEIQRMMLQKHDYVYATFEAIARKGLDEIRNIDLVPELKQAMEEESSKAGARSFVTYIGAPKFRIAFMAEKFEVAKKTISNTVEKQRVIFDFSREESKKAHQQGQAA
jgi:translation initiation factor 2 subunit 1